MIEVKISMTGVVVEKQRRDEKVEDLTTEGEEYWRGKICDGRNERRMDTRDE